MVEVIRERTSLADARTRAYVEWQTKAITGFIASTAQSEKGARELHKAAERLSMMPASDGPDGEPVRAPVAEPRPGSFERLGGFFGGGMAR